MQDAEQFVGRFGSWPQRIALGLAVVWGVAAGLTFAFGRLEQAWLLFVGGYQTILLLAAGVTVLRGMLLRRGEWRPALLLGVGMMTGATTLYLLAVALTSAQVPAGLVELASGVTVRRKPDMWATAPGFYLASVAVGTALGPGLLLLSPQRQLGRRRQLRAPALLPPPALYRAQGDPFVHGSLPTRTVRVAAGQGGAPAPLVIHAPGVPGEYPVVLFQHGMLLQPGSFGDVLEHLASHGFVTVAPQMYDAGRLLLSVPTSQAEAELAARVLEWITDGLGAFAPARADALGIAGHSRGAKVAWWLLRGGQTGATAVAGVDPVDSAPSFGGDPRVLGGTFVPAVPALIIGTELGPNAGPVRSPCAPAGRNHVQFFEGCASPAWHAVLRQTGHLDMLDDDARLPLVPRRICAGGPDRAGARRATAGLLAAFFRGTLQGDAQALGALASPEAAPVPVTVTRK